MQKDFCKVNYLRLLFTSFTNSFAGLKAGIKCSGISTAIFFLIFLPIFAALFLVYSTYKPIKIGIESVGFQKFIKVFFEQECRKRGKYPSIVELKNTSKSKQSRISSLAPLFQNGQIYLRKNMFDLLSEYDGYPETEHDDVLDALSMVKDLAVPQASSANYGRIPRYIPHNEDINF